MISPLIVEAHAAQVQYWFDYEKNQSVVNYRETQQNKNNLQRMKELHTKVNKIIILALVQLKDKNKRVIPLVCAYLSVNQLFYGSGYWKEKLLVKLRQIDLTEEEKKDITVNFY